jgi:hypothetical protein
MSPQLELMASENVLLALPGKEYVAFFPRGGTNDLKLLSGTYEVSWANPSRNRIYQAS